MREREIDGLMDEGEREREGEKQMNNIAHCLTTAMLLLVMIMDSIN